MSIPLSVISEKENVQVFEKHGITYHVKTYLKNKKLWKLWNTFIESEWKRKSYRDPRKQTIGILKFNSGENTSLYVVTFFLLLLLEDTLVLMWLLMNCIGIN